jgi:hypothetical protein
MTGGEGRRNKAFFHSSILRKKKFKADSLSNNSAVLRRNFNPIYYLLYSFRVGWDNGGKDGLSLQENRGIQKAAWKSVSLRSRQGGNLP